MTTAQATRARGPTSTPTGGLTLPRAAHRRREPSTGNRTRRESLAAANVQVRPVGIGVARARTDPPREHDLLERPDRRARRSPSREAHGRTRRAWPRASATPWRARGVASHASGAGVRASSTRGPVDIGHRGAPDLGLRLRRGPAGSESQVMAPRATSVGTTVSSASCRGQENRDRIGVSYPPMPEGRCDARTVPFRPSGARSIPFNPTGPASSTR